MMESLSSDSYSRSSKHKKSKSSHKSPSKSSPSHHEKYSHRSSHIQSNSHSYSGSSHSDSEQDDDESETEVVSRRRDAVRSSRRESVRSTSVSSRSNTDDNHDSESDNSYYSRSVSRSPSNKQSSHRKKNRNSGSKRSRSHDRHHSRSPPRESKRRKNTREERDPRDKSSREIWDNEVMQIGCWMKDTIFHFCDTCDRPIFVYGRLIPCKHVYCFNCAGTHKEKCKRCNEKVMRVERAELGSIHMCFQGGSTHSKNGCRRTYLSQRDLEAHMSHRHKTAPMRSLSSNSATSAIGSVQPMSDQGGHTVMAASAQQQNQMSTITPTSAATGPPGVNAFPLHPPPHYTVPPNAFSVPTNNFSRPPPANQFSDHSQVRPLTPGAQYGVIPVQHHMPHQGQPWPQPGPQY